mgnify:CR=1 FL=1
MEITGKQYRCYHSISYFRENDIQGGGAFDEKYIYIYIYNGTSATTYFSRKKEVDNTLRIHNNGTNLFEPFDREIQIQNLNKSIKSGNDTRLKKYKILKNKNLEMKWRNPETNEMDLVFKGEILLNGDAIKGVFYNKGKQATPLRVYYNVGEPLPGTLIPEKDDKIA